MAKLQNAPLKEVIFEIRWILMPSEESGQMYDPGFELASGRLNAIIENEFPYYQRIIPPEVPEPLLQYQAVHQYWKAENTWPVIQLGPEIFTINCTEEWYDWEENFYPLIKRAVEWLIQAYRQPLQLNFTSLRYIDIIKVEEYGGIQQGWQAFIDKHFYFSFTNSFNIDGSQRLRYVQINQVFEIENGSLLQIQMNSGRQNNDLAFIWHTALFKRELFTKESLLIWVDSAHSFTSKLFKQMVKPETYEKFGKGNEV